MSDTKIQWTNKTWNPTTGCTKVSAGCANCYAERMWKRLSRNSKHAAYGRKFTDVRMHEKRLDYPVHIRKPAMFFVDSMSDLFHEKVEDRFIADVFKRMAACPQHTFQILTKRPRRMMEFLKQVEFVGVWVKDKGKETFHVENHPMPLPNVWLGVSCEDQKTADERIPLLLETPAAVRFVSAEPLLGKIDLFHCLNESYCCPECGDGQGFEGERCHCGGRYITEHPALDWVIVGGESGKKARPMHPDWARSLRDQCVAAGVPFFFKQWGKWYPLASRTVIDAQRNAPRPGQLKKFEGRKVLETMGEIFVKYGKKGSGRMLDGKEWNQFPGRQ